MGISERSVISAIRELHKEGLIIPERKYSNRYTFTPRILSQIAQNEKIEQPEQIAEETSKNFTSQSENFAPAYKEQVIKQEKQQPDKRLGGNVYSMEETQILKDYAIKHNAKNINAYIAKLRQNGSGKQIIKDYKKKNFILKRAEDNILETQRHIEELKKLHQIAVLPSESEVWQSLGKKFGLK